MNEFDCLIYMDNYVMMCVDFWVWEVMELFFFMVYGNVGSLNYYFGEEVCEVVELVCWWIVNVIGVVFVEIFFISGVMEVNNFVLFGMVELRWCCGDYFFSVVLEYCVVFDLF